MKPRVLVVEDERSIYEPLAEHLTREGFDPTVAPTLAEAETTMETLDPDFVLPSTSCCRTVTVEISPRASA